MVWGFEGQNFEESHTHIKHEIRPICATPVANPIELRTKAAY